MRTIRKNQVISPFGLGAIYDYQGESFVHSMTKVWPSDGKIQLKRLERSVGVDHFRRPPFASNHYQANDFQKVRFRRFPAWNFCPRSNCRKMVRLRPKDEKEGKAPVCSSCRSTLVPMRFVSICEHGHLDDVDWAWWVHSGLQGVNCRSRDKLKFVTRANRGTGLGALFIECTACGKSKSLEGLTHKDKMKTIGIKCRGTHPWQSQGEECRAIPQVVQRGASNVYFPKVVSALDIPMVEGGVDQSQLRLNIKGSSTFTLLLQMYDTLDTGGDVLENTMCKILIDRLCQEEECEPDLIVSVLHESDDELENVYEAYDEDRMLYEEWKALTGSLPSSPNFRKLDVVPAGVVEGADGITESCLKLIDRLSVVTRIREVRALSGFERFKTTGDHVVSMKLQAKHWMPALEVFGEGIFFTLDEASLRAWETRNKKFIAPRIGAAVGSWAENGLGSFLPEPNARFVLLHTLSHLLMRQIVFECGYSSSSLKERIYSSVGGDETSPMAGILIYTADSDSEGALGGLVDQGRVDRFFSNLISALSGADWCSNDPICSEIEGQGLAGLNRAACHACALMAETSCVYGNALLDRTLLLGTKPETDDFSGYFEPLMQEIRES